MALVRKLEPMQLEHSTRHTEVDATYSILRDDGGRVFLQVDTYGSKERQIIGKKSQSIRFAPEALQQLKTILAKNGL